MNYLCAQDQSLDFVSLPALIMSLCYVILDPATDELSHVMASRDEDGGILTSDEQGAMARPKYSAATSTFQMYPTVLKWK